MKIKARKPILSGNSYFLTFAALYGLVLFISGCGADPHASGIKEIDLKMLMEASRSTQAASTIDLSQHKILDPKKVSKELAAVFPVHNYLMGEVYRRRGDNAQAKKAYQGLVEWAADDPYGDGWGANGLVALALWRWLQFSNELNVTADQREHLLKMSSKVWDTRLVRAMFKPLQGFNIFGSLPQLQEDILRRLTSLAWSIGKKEEARRLFMEYLSVARTSDLTPVEKTLLDESVSSGVLSLERVALYRGKRLESFGHYEGASEWLNKAYESGGEQVKAEAGLSIARLRRKTKDEKCATPVVLGLLSDAIDHATDPDVVQQALLYRAEISIREGCLKNESQFKKDLNRVIEDFPQGQFADDALFLLASYYVDHYWRDVNDSELEEALRLFAKLRDFKGSNDFLDSLRLKPAMALYSRGKREDIQKAISLLQELEKERPFGPFHLNALFWLGRMAAETGDGEGSKSYFKKIIEESPYDYYAIRARMHLNLGNEARKELHADQRTKDELEKAFLESKETSSLSGTSPYHKRLRTALEAGLYSAGIEDYSSLRKKFPSERLEDIPLDKLDKEGLLSPIAILLSLRQDALPAADLPPDPFNRLEIAGAIGHFTHDWPLIFYLTAALDKPYEIRAATQRDPRYLATAYPRVYDQWLKKYNGDWQLPEGLLYGVMRIESAFYPEALSTEGALGLFQFIPPTFESLNNDWGLLKITGRSSRQEFLLDPELSIYLGARWFKERCLRRQKGDVLLAILDHISGPSPVKEWRGMWTRMGRGDDYEYMLETARFRDAADFGRKVLTGLWIVEAAGIHRKN